MAKILVVDDDQGIREFLEIMLKGEGYRVTTASDAGKALNRCKKEAFDLIITDLKMPKMDGIGFLREIKAISPETLVILITAYASGETAVNAMKEGAYDYIEKDFAIEDMKRIVRNALSAKGVKKEDALFLKEVAETTGFGGMVGNSRDMVKVYATIRKIANTPANVLILGESGTGKELVANAIHRLSLRSGKPFIKINCAAIPETLFETELFGHEKGAYTGALETRKGKFEFADGGTIFFDEIGDIPLSLQPKLLRVLEDQTITRLGGNTPVKVDVRSIYATRKSLKESVASGEFREDLFYRINVIPITVPPLRDRKEDIPYLIDHFLKHFREKMKKDNLKLSQSAYDSLLAYNYPGNVRELKHSIERAVVLSKEGIIDQRCLPDEISGNADRIPCISKDLTLEASMKCFERQRILKALNETGGKKIEAAGLLGISRKVLWKKLKEYDID